MRRIVVDIFGAVGAAVVLYISIRVLATVIDIWKRWRRSRAGDKNAWD
jgi:hypothetical protein